MFLAGSLNQIWSLIHSQQIIMLLPLHKIVLPANVGVYYNVMMQIAAFDVVEMDNYYNRMTGQSTAALSFNFQLIGYDSMWLINNLGTLGLIFSFFPLIYLIPALLAPFSALRHLRKTREKLMRTFYWSSPIRLLLESYILIVICSLINARWLKWKSNWDKLNTCLTFFFVIAALIVPFVVSKWLKKYRHMLDKKDFKSRFGSMYADMRTDTKNNGLTKYLTYYF